jgi:hypothetical protein
LVQTNTIDKTASDETESAGWEGVDMVLIALFSFSAGILLALRWNVLVLLAAIVAVLPLVAVIDLARGEDAGSLALDMLVAFTFIEIGYIARLAAYVFVAAARAATRTAIVAKHADHLAVLPETVRARTAPRGTNTP